MEPCTALVFYVALLITAQIQANYIYFGESSEPLPGQAQYYLQADSNTPQVEPTEELRRIQRASFWRKLLKGSLFDDDDDDDCPTCCNNNNNIYGAGNGDAGNLTPPPPPPQLQPQRPPPNYYNPYNSPLQLHPLRILQPLFSRPFAALHGLGGDPYGQTVGPYGGNRPAANYNSNGGYGGGYNPNQGYGGNSPAYSGNENAVPTNAYDGKQPINESGSNAYADNSPAYSGDGNAAPTNAYNGKQPETEGDSSAYGGKSGPNYNSGHEAKKSSAAAENYEANTDNSAHKQEPAVPAYSNKETANYDNSKGQNESAEPAPAPVYDAPAEPATSNDNYSAPTDKSDYSKPKTPAEQKYTAKPTSPAADSTYDSAQPQKDAYAGANYAQQPQILYQPIIYVSPQYQVPAPPSPSYETEPTPAKSHDAHSQSEHPPEYSPVPDSYHNDVVPTDTVKYDDPAAEHAQQETTPETATHYETPPKTPAAPVKHHEPAKEVNNYDAIPAAPIEDASCACGCGQPCCGLGSQQCLTPIYRPCQECGGTSAYGSPPIPVYHGQQSPLAQNAIYPTQTAPPPCSQVAALPTYNEPSAPATLPSSCPHNHMCNNPSTIATFSTIVFPTSFATSQPLPAPTYNSVTSGNAHTASTYNTANSEPSSKDYAGPSNQAQQSSYSTYNSAASSLGGYSGALQPAQQSTYSAPPPSNGCLEQQSYSSISNGPTASSYNSIESPAPNYNAGASLSADNLVSSQPASYIPAMKLTIADQPYRVCPELFTEYHYQQLAAARGY